MENKSALSKFAWLAVAAAVLTIGLKTGAYWVTGSVGLLSDALESGANLATALLALLVLRIASQPPDQEHAYGHEKAEYFSSGVEGAAILIAAGVMGFVGIRRLFLPQPLAQLDLGLSMSLLATLVNFAGAKILFRESQKSRSIVLEAQARHLMVDVWTSGGVIVGISAVVITGWQILDPVIAVGVCFHVTWEGLRLVQRSILGLMDSSLSQSELERIYTILEDYAGRGVRYHALRTRQSGTRSFVSIHIQVPGKWSVQEGHDLLEEMEGKINRALPSATLLTHLEPVEDPSSWDDQHLDR